jgi:hypothetical protein
MELNDLNFLMVKNDIMTISNHLGMEKHLGSS